MQKKINIIIWSFVLCSFIFFTILSIYNPFQIKKYQFQVKKDYAVEVSIYSKNKKKAQKTLKELQNNVSFTSSLEDLKKLLEGIKNANISEYFIQVDNHIALGNYPEKGKFKVALTGTDHNLYKIIDTTNQIILIEDVVGEENYNRMIITADTLEAATNTLKKAKNKSLSQIKEESYSSDIQLLKNTKLVYQFTSQ